MTTQTHSKPQRQLSVQRIMLSIEGLTVFLSSIALYWQIGANGWMFVLLLLAPDLTFIVYMLDKSLGTKAYNIMHTYTFPISLGMISLLTGWQLGIALALIWTAHIGMDRILGYGLKYETGFKDTHLTRA
jgi:Domain of unknown function (DUF4260)